MTVFATSSKESRCAPNTSRGMAQAMSPLEGLPSPQPHFSIAFLTLNHHGTWRWPE